MSSVCSHRRRCGYLESRRRVNSSSLRIERTMSSSKTSCSPPFSFFNASSTNSRVSDSSVKAGGPGETGEQRFLRPVFSVQSSISQPGHKGADKSAIRHSRRAAAILPITTCGPSRRVLHYHLQRRDRRPKDNSDLPALARDFCTDFVALFQYFFEFFSELALTCWNTFFFTDVASLLTILPA